MELEGFRVNLLRTFRRILGHCLGLKNRTLVALTLQNALFTLVLFYVWNVGRAVRLGLVAAMALRRARSRPLASTLR